MILSGKLIVSSTATMWLVFVGVLRVLYQAAHLVLL
jgi:hypothetical protein